MPRKSKSTPAAGAWPVVALISDFGLEDWYVASLKAVLLRHCPSCRLVDVTHGVRQGDILQASVTLERAIDVFPAGAVHLAVVDPGVGSDRRLLVAEVNGQRIVCPDNGLITWAWRRHGGGRAYELTWRPARSSNTFHGRDIMAPVAGMLACGTAVESIAKPLAQPVLLDVAPAEAPAIRGRIIHCDHFGNAMTNVPKEALPAAGAVRISVKGRDLGPVRRTYSDVEPATPLALIGSAGLLEIAVRGGTAAAALGLKAGDEVRIETSAQAH